MKGDFSRLTFNEVNRYSRVLMQQGRVLLDSDWNEAAEIQIHYLRALARDIIGPHGAPAGPDGAEGTGFLVDKRMDGANEVNNDFAIGAGRYYVQGILCENAAGAAYRAQPDWTGQPDFVAGSYLVYLDVWERHIADVEALTSLLDPALGTADTCTRSRIVWQVKVRRLDVVPAPAETLRDNYDDFLKALGVAGLGQGKLAARVEQPAEPDTPCLSAPEARYRGTENQLYRVEIHRGGDPADQGTFKWSRENGSEIYPVDTVSGAVLTLATIGRDDRSTLQPDDWVELVDDNYTLQNRAEPLLRVLTVSRETNEVTVDPPPASNTGTRRYLRRWNSGLINIATATKAAKDGWIGLEDGVQVKFTPPEGPWVTGQFWTIPARTATGDVIWPQDADKAASPPQGIEHSYAPLALVGFKASRSVDGNVVDLRRKLVKSWK